jgi:hypothetical protein
MRKTHLYTLLANSARQFGIKYAYFSRNKWSYMVCYHIFDPFFSNRMIAPGGVE